MSKAYLSLLVLIPMLVTTNLVRADTTSKFRSPKFERLFPRNCPASIALASALVGEGELVHEHDPAELLRDSTGQDVFAPHSHGGRHFYPDRLTRLREIVSYAPDDNVRRYEVRDTVGKAFSGEIIVDFWGWRVFTSIKGSVNQPVLVKLMAQSKFSDEAVVVDLSGHDGIENNLKDKTFGFHFGSLLHIHNGSAIADALINEPESVRLVVMEANGREHQAKLSWAESRGFELRWRPNTGEHITGTTISVYLNPGEPPIRILSGTPSWTFNETASKQISPNVSTFRFPIFLNGARWQNTGGDPNGSAVGWVEIDTWRNTATWLLYGHNLGQPTSLKMFANGTSSSHSASIDLTPHMGSAYRNTPESSTPALGEGHSVYGTTTLPSDQIASMVLNPDRMYFALGTQSEGQTRFITGSLMPPQNNPIFTAEKALQWRADLIKYMQRSNNGGSARTQSFNLARRSSSGGEVLTAIRQGTYSPERVFKASSPLPERPLVFNTPVVTHTPDTSESHTTHTDAAITGDSDIGNPLTTIVNEAASNHHTSTPIASEVVDNVIASTHTAVESPIVDVESQEVVVRSDVAVQAIPGDRAIQLVQERGPVEILPVYGPLRPEDIVSPASHYPQSAENNFSGSIEIENGNINLDLEMNRPQIFTEVRLTLRSDNGSQASITKWNGGNLDLNYSSNSGNKVEGELELSSLAGNMLEDFQGEWVLEFWSGDSVTLMRLGE